MYISLQTTLVAGRVRALIANLNLKAASPHIRKRFPRVAEILAAGKSAIVHVRVNDSPKLPAETIVDSEPLLPGEGMGLESTRALMRKTGLA